MTSCDVRWILWSQSECWRMMENGSGHAFRSKLSVDPLSPFGVYSRRLAPGTMSDFCKLHLAFWTSDILYWFETSLVVVYHIANQLYHLVQASLPVITWLLSLFPGAFSCLSGATSFFCCFGGLPLLMLIDRWGRAADCIIRRRQSPATLRGFAYSIPATSSRTENNFDKEKLGLVLHLRSHDLCRPASSAYLPREVRQMADIALRSQRIARDRLLQDLRTEVLWYKVWLYRRTLLASIERLLDHIPDFEVH